MEQIDPICACFSTRIETKADFLANHNRWLKASGVSWKYEDCIDFLPFRINVNAWNKIFDSNDFSSVEESALALIYTLFYGIHSSKITISTFLSKNYVGLSDISQYFVSSPIQGYQTQQIRQGIKRIRDTNTAIRLSLHKQWGYQEIIDYTKYVDPNITRSKNWSSYATAIAESKLSFHFEDWNIFEDGKEGLRLSFLTQIILLVFGCRLYPLKDHITQIFETSNVHNYHRFVEDSFESAILLQNTPKFDILVSSFLPCYSTNPESPSKDTFVKQMLKVVKLFLDEGIPQITKSIASVYKTIQILKCNNHPKRRNLPLGKAICQILAEKLSSDHQYIMSSLEFCEYIFDNFIDDGTQFLQNESTAFCRFCSAFRFILSKHLLDSFTLSEKELFIQELIYPTNATLLKVQKQVFIACDILIEIRETSEIVELSDLRHFLIDQPDDGSKNDNYIFELPSLSRIYNIIHRNVMYCDQLRCLSNTLKPQIDMIPKLISRIDQYDIKTARLGLLDIYKISNHANYIIKMLEGDIKNVKYAAFIDESAFVLMNNAFRGAKWNFNCMKKVISDIKIRIAYDQNQNIIRYAKKCFLNLQATFRYLSHVYLDKSLLMRCMPIQVIADDATTRKIFDHFIHNGEHESTSNINFPTIGLRAVEVGIATKEYKNHNHETASETSIHESILPPLSRFRRA